VKREKKKKKRSSVCSPALHSSVDMANDKRTDDNKLIMNLLRKMIKNK
jgi:hypothetical protein